MSELETWLRGVLEQAENLVYDVQSQVSQMGYRPDFDADNRALARIEAERAILDLHKQWPEPGVPGSIRYCSEFEHDCQEFPCPTVEWLAFGRRFDAPGYRAEWAPEGVRAQ